MRVRRRQRGGGRRRRTVACALCARLRLGVQRWLRARRHRQRVHGVPAAAAAAAPQPPSPPPPERCTPGFVVSKAKKNGEHSCDKKVGTGGGGPYLAHDLWHTCGTSLCTEEIHTSTGCVGDKAYMRHGDDGCGCTSAQGGGIVCECGDGSVAGAGVGAPLHAHTMCAAAPGSATMASSSTPPATRAWCPRRRRLPHIAVAATSAVTVAVAFPSAAVAAAAAATAAAGAAAGVALVSVAVHAKAGRDDARGDARERRRVVGGAGPARRRALYPTAFNQTA